MKKEIEELKKLGADIEEVHGGLRLNGYWKDIYNDYNELFVEITGYLVSNKKEDKDFLKNLKKIGDYTTHIVQEPTFLSNLKYMNRFYTHVEQHPYFLSNLYFLNELLIPNSKQHPNFLSNLKELKDLSIQSSKQHSEFLSNSKSLEFLHTNEVQDKYFLRNVIKIRNITIGSSLPQDEIFLRNLKENIFLNIDKKIQYPNFLKQIN
jgi:hypothetical protein